MLLSTIINEFKDSFFHIYNKNLLPSHIKALESMARCRQEHGPHMLARCSNRQCGEQVYIPPSCGHRNCPHCQNHESRQWLESQLDKRLPCQYYLVTFTLPPQLRDLAWKHQKTVYSLMFRAVQDLLKSFTHNDKKLGGSPGFTAILHTHSRTLDYHPHIHVGMPAASINLQTGLWKEKSGKYLFSHKALSPRCSGLNSSRPWSKTSCRFPMIAPRSGWLTARMQATARRPLSILAATCTGASSGSRTFCSAGTAGSPSAIAMPKAEKTIPEPSRASTSSTCSCSMCCPEDFDGQGRMAFSMHAAKSSSVSCNWCCGPCPGAPLPATSSNGLQSFARPAGPPW